MGSPWDMLSTRENVSPGVGRDGKKQQVHAEPLE